METTVQPKQTLKKEPLLVTPDNFKRAESDMYFNRVAVTEGAFGKFYHRRELFSIDDQAVVRGNRDTLYSSAVFDLDAGPVTITLPDTGKRFMSLMMLDEDQYAFDVKYDPGAYTYSKDNVGTRYILAAIRTLVDPSDQADLKAAHALQDAVMVQQKSPGKFEIPDWDEVSQQKIRKALKELGETITSFDHAFGSKDQVDPVKHLIATACGWGGNPDKEAMYMGVTPQKNDGKTIYRLTVKDVPVDAFWSVSVYNAEGFFEKNKLNAYSVNNITAKKETDGSVIIQFGGCDGKVVNCLPVTPGWNYTVRLYRPRPEILNGQWKFPEAEIAK